MRTLDLANPMRSLREAAGLKTNEAARLRGVSPPAQSKSESQGSRVELATLLAAAEAWGIPLDAVTLTVRAPKVPVSED